MSCSRQAVFVLTMTMLLTSGAAAQVGSALESVGGGVVKATADVAKGAGRIGAQVGIGTTYGAAKAVITGGLLGLFSTSYFLTETLAMTSIDVGKTVVTTGAVAAFDVAGGVVKGGWRLLRKRPSHSVREEP